MSAARKKYGVLIVLEGIDNSGKTTQAHLLAKHLDEAGHEVVESREPEGTTRGGAALRHLLKEPPASKGWNPWTQVFLFLASRHEHVHHKVRPSLETGKVVVLDRFTHSTLAYQAVGGGIPRKQLDPLLLLAADGIVPDLVLVLDIPAKVAAGRVSESEHAYYERRGTPWQEKVRLGFLSFEKEAKRRRKNNAARALQFHVVKANRPVDVVEYEIRESVDALLRERGIKPKGKPASKKKAAAKKKNTPKKKTVAKKKAALKEKPVAKGKSASKKKPAAKGKGASARGAKK